VLPARIVCLRSLGLLLPSLVFVGVGVVAGGTLRGQTGSGQAGGRSMGSGNGSNSMPGSPMPATTVAPSTVQGQVINAATGAPVPRALVRLNNRAVLTDHEGKFRFDQNTDSNANVMVTKPGFWATTEMQDAGNLSLQGAQMAAPLELRLYPEALLTGTVIAPDGTPLPRISVTAVRSFFDTNGHRWLIAGQAQTDSHGNFRLPVQAGDYRLETRYSPIDRMLDQAVLPVTVPADDSSNTSGVIQIHSGEEQHFELRPAVSPSHMVTVTTPSAGGGREFMRITARSSSGATLQVNPQMDGVGGEVKLQLPQGTYTLMATRNNPENPEQAETTVTVPDHDISGVVFQFSPIPSIPVELIVEPSPGSDTNQPPTLQQFGLTLENDQPDTERGDSTIRPITRRDQSLAFTTPPGSYRLEGRNTGVWYIKSANYGDSDLLRQNLVSVPGAGGTPIRITVSDQTGSLQGTVSLNGSPAACWVYVIPSGPSAQSVISLRSGSSGSYTSAHLPPGSYQVVAFEHRHSVNYKDPASLTPFGNHVQSVTVNAGDKPMLNLVAVPVAEVAP
jgi:Carboxypeptidase regulatory-like domain